MKHMNLAKLAGLTAAAALTLAPAFSLADTAQSALVQGGALNLRETASLNAKVLGQYPTGTLVEIVESGSEWHKVLVNGKSGYMMAKYLNTGMDATGIKAVVRTNTGIGLNLREEPSLSGAIITSYKPGAEVTVLQKGSVWSRVQVNGKEGFMATQYLNFASGSVQLPAAGKVALVNNPKDTQVLNLRQEASLDAKVLAYYRNGAKVTILKSGSTWHKVQTEDGKVGYMMSRYLKLTDETAAVKPYTAKLINVNGGKIVNFRSGPSLNASIVDKIAVGTKVQVIEHGTDWCRVNVDGREGYISTWFMKPVSE
ncbi:MAG: SH3 domain-containing protein [Clostridia bacterium]|nr:SH3 domain-containing protein [Clostridia bacterium]